jgi:hypothetical protein
METATGMEGVLDVATQDRLHRPQRAAGDHRPGLVHPKERRVVTALADAGNAVATHRRCGEPPDDFDVARRVAQTQVVVRGGLGGEPRFGADRPEEVQAGPEPAWRERMARSEVIGGRARSVDQQHAWHDTGHGTRLHLPAA